MSRDVSKLIYEMAMNDGDRNSKLAKKLREMHDEMYPSEDELIVRVYKYVTKQIIAGKNNWCYVHKCVGLDNSRIPGSICINVTERLCTDVNELNSRYRCEINGKIYIVHDEGCRKLIDDAILPLGLKWYITKIHYYNRDCYEMYVSWEHWKNKK